MNTLVSKLGFRSHQASALKSLLRSYLGENGNVRQLHVRGEAGFPIHKYIESKLNKASLTSDKEITNLEFNNQLALSFPTIWFRDNCRCDACFDHIAKSRLIDQQDFKPDTKPLEIKVDNEVLKIVWDDGHQTSLDKEWLCKHSFEKVHQGHRAAQLHVPRIPWTSKTFNNIYKTVSYDDVMSRDEALLEWLDALATYGVACVSKAPIQEGVVRKLATRVAFIRNTLYGEEFNVKSVEGATNTAYKKGQLQMHSDMPFYHHLPGAILLHCIVQSREGGENLLVDAIQAAHQLSSKSYHYLSNTVVNWTDIGRDGRFNFHSVNREPVICEDKLGNIRKINWSQPQRDSEFNVSTNEAIEWYKAMKEYTNLLHNPSNAVSLKMQPGDILTIDNRRLLHSRANYSDGARHLQGAYIDWDEIYPLIRVLRRKQQAR